MAEQPPQKRKRKEIRGTGGVEDTEDEAELACRWAESLVPRSSDQVESSSGGNSVAVWYPRHGVAVVVSLKGKMMSSMGVTGIGGQLLLLAEEALYMAERRYLTLHDGGETTLEGFADAAVGAVEDATPSNLSPQRNCGDSSVEITELSHRSSSNNNSSSCITSKDSKVTMHPVLSSTEALYGALTDAAGVPLPCYLAYRTLRDKGFVLRRPSALVVATVDDVVTAGGGGGNHQHHAQQQSATTTCRVSPHQPPPRLPLYRPSAPLGSSAVAFEAFEWCVPPPVFFFLCLAYFT